MQLREVINELLGEKNEKILLNLSQVSSIDSSGVGELVASLKFCQRFGAALKLLRAGSAADRVMRMSQILPMFDVYDSEDEALQEFLAAQPNA